MRDCFPCRDCIQLVSVNMFFVNLPNEMLHELFVGFLFKRQLSTSETLNEKPAVISEIE